MAHGGDALRWKLDRVPTPFAVMTVDQRGDMNRASATIQSRSFLLVAAVASFLAGCSNIFVHESVQHDLSKKGYVSELKFNVWDRWFTERLARYEFRLDVPRDLVPPCVAGSQPCALPGPFLVKLVESNTKLVVVDKKVDRPKDIGGGSTSDGQTRRPYVIALLLEIQLPQGSYVVSVENLNDDPRFENELTPLIFQYVPKQ